MQLCNREQCVTHSHISQCDRESRYCWYIYVCATHRYIHVTQQSTHTFHSVIERVDTAGIYMCVSHTVLYYTHSSHMSQGIERVDCCVRERVDAVV